MASPELLSGSHGIGKSDFLQEFGGARGLRVHVLDLSLLEATDLTGLPYQDAGRTRFAPPAHLPSAGEGPSMLVLEELNRCDRSVRQPCLQLLTARRLNDYRLPDGCFVVACVNPVEGGYDVDELVIRRMQALLEPIPTHQGDAQRELRDWSASSRPLRCVRAASRALGAQGRLDDEGIEQLLALAARWERGTRDAELSDVERAAFRLLVLAGEPPRTALESVRAWDPWRGELPNGQWLPEDRLPRSPAGPVEVAGVRLGSRSSTSSRRSTPPSIGACSCG